MLMCLFKNKTNTLIACTCHYDTIQYLVDKAVEDAAREDAHHSLSVHTVLLSQRHGLSDRLNTGLQSLKHGQIW